MTLDAPALVGISHGTSSATGQAVVRQLFEDSAQRLSTAIAETAADSTAPAARLGHVDVQQPDVRATVDSLDEGCPVVVVPLLLSAGFHVNVDLRDELKQIPRASTITAALGPDDRLIRLLAQRLKESGADPEQDTIILGAAGSSDAAAVRDCEETAARLATHLGTEVTVAYLSFAKPSVAEAVEQVRERTATGQIVVASYLLAPGFFQNKLHSAGADITTEPLLAPDRDTAPEQLVEVVLERYQQGCAQLTPEAPSQVAPAPGALPPQRDRHEPKPEPVTITAEQLHELQETGAPVSILDVRWRQDRPEGLPEYLAGHIPGAVFVDLDYELAGLGATPETGPHPLPDQEAFQDAARRWGITREAPIVVYDDLKNLSSARAWWLLRHAGFTDVRVLDGSLRAWTSAGYGLETEMSFPEPSDVTVHFGSMPTVGIDELADLIGERSRGGSANQPPGANQPRPDHQHDDDTPLLLDARPATRYAGQDDPLSPRPGHIPGAVSAPTTENIDQQGRLLPAEQLQDRFTQLGVDSTRDAVVYCYSGVHSAHEVLALTAAGFEAALFPGGFGQWSANPELPVQNPAQG